MKAKLIIDDVIKEFSNSNIKKLKVKYGKLEIELEKENETKENVDINKEDNEATKINSDEKWILSPIVRQIL
ncbi:MAG: hypothetical protein IKP28_03355 [Clostridia bacterium]|nr:hypothetical protein [Clostridia bacterium]